MLESGDNLSRVEFHQRYCQRPDIKRAELIDGVVYVASPVSDFHGAPHLSVASWLGAYRARHPELHASDNVTVFLGDDTEVQPDACLWREEPDGLHLTAEGYIEGAPQLVVEVAATSASYDLHQKLDIYRRNGVRDYIVWRVFDAMVNWYGLRNGQYVLMEPDESGIIESQSFPGLRLNVPKLLADDLAGVLAELGQLPTS
jgi:Uma2 family endonuclease